MSGIDRPACDLVRRSLESVIASETFGRSERLRSFLSYIVESELSGKAAQLKGYSIGIDVFSRPSGFDAGSDPLVRVQAGKLRKLLERYYQTEGAADRLRIRVPLGSYVPEYSVTQDAPETVSKPASAGQVPSFGVNRQKEEPRRSWLPAPVSSPLALFSLLPLLFLAPSVYPDATNTAIAKAQLVFSVQNKFAQYAQALPRLTIVQCWPAGGECNSLARAITNAANYHKTVRLDETGKTNHPQPLSYSIRIENHADGRGIYARLIHDLSGITIYTRHFSRAQLKSEAGIAYEAVAFTARALSASGPLYRHAARAGIASSVMECLAETERGSPRGTPHTGPAPACSSQAPDALAKAGTPDTHGEIGVILTR